MVRDVLTREQLQEQLQRRYTYLKYLRQTCADEQVIRDVEKSIRLTQIRLDRMEDGKDVQTNN